MRIGPMEALALVVLLVLLVGFVVVRRQSRPAGANLEEIFGEPSGAGPGPLARRWALGVLFEAGVDSDSDPVYAIRVLRQAEPRLSLLSAKLLIDTLNRF